MSKYSLENNSIYEDRKELSLDDVLLRLNSMGGLDATLKKHGLPKKHVYTTGEVSCLLEVSRSCVISYCDNFLFGDKPSLEFHRKGTRRYITYHSLHNYMMK